MMGGELSHSIAYNYVFKHGGLTLLMFGYGCDVRQLFLICNKLWGDGVWFVTLNKRN